MSDYQQKDGFGNLFQNDKQKDSHPDYRGEARVNGKVVEIAGWKKMGKNGKPYLSLKFQDPRAKDETRKPAPKNAPELDDDSALPF